MHAAEQRTVLQDYVAALINRSGLYAAARRDFLRWQLYTDLARLSCITLSASLATPSSSDRICSYAEGTDKSCVTAVSNSVVAINPCASGQQCC